jgi:Ca2+-binding RTX toxin-like protein
MSVGRAGVVAGVVLAVGWSLPATAGSANRGSDVRAATCDGRAATIVGTPGHDQLQGTPGADVIAGLAGNDTLTGLGGRDRICGGRGSDRLLGGRGDDHLLGGLDRLHVTDEGSTERDGDVLVGGGGDDLMLPGRDSRTADDVIPDSVSWESATRGVHVDVAAGRATGEGRDRFDARGASVVGSDHADTIRGSRRDDRLFSGRGDDRVLGRAGDDHIVTDPSQGRGGDDLALGGRGADQISSWAGEDVSRGGQGADLIDDMGRAADRLYGGAGPDRLFTQIVDDPGVDQVVDGGKGAHDLVDLHTQTVNPSGLASTATWDMATGKLVFTLDHAVPVSVVHIERGDLSAWGTTWTVRGTSAADELLASGSSGTVFTGRQGDDMFMGSSYDDTFLGGAGTDHSLGMGPGVDTCVSVEVIDGDDCESVTP